VRGGGRDLHSRPRLSAAAEPVRGRDPRRHRRRLRRARRRLPTGADTGMVDTGDRRTLEGGRRLRCVDRDAGAAAAGHLRTRAHAMTLPAISFSAFGQPEFWIGVGVLAGIYGIFVLALQLNVGFTGIINFGQVGFMSVGAYAMAVLVLKAHWSFWLALPTASAVTVAAGLLIGLPSLRLRADYFAIATIAFAEIIRYVAENARDLTNGNIGLLGFDSSWVSVSNSIQGWLSTSEIQLPLLLVTWLLFGLLTVVMRRVQRTPWGRVLRAVREDEDAARALGKNVFLYKLQSLAIAALLGSVAGYLLALDLAYISPDQFDPSVTFIGYAILILGGLASYTGIAAGTTIMWILLEGTRFINLPLSAEQIAALRFVIVGVVLIGLMAFRPQGLFGKREEMVLGG